MKRTGPAALALVVLLGCNTEVDSIPRPDQLTAAKNFVTHLGKGAYAEAVRTFNADLAKAMPTDGLEKTWRGLVDRFGALQRFNGVRASEASEFQIVYLRGRHEHGELDVRMVFKGGTEIAGLWFRPPDKEKSYEPVQIEVTRGAGIPPSGHAEGAVEPGAPGEEAEPPEAPSPAQPEAEAAAAHP